MNKLRTFVVVFLLSLPGLLQAQNSCEIIQQIDDKYLVGIDGQTFFAFSREKVEEFKRLKQTNDALEDALDKLKKVASSDEALIAALQASQQKYRELAQRYQQLATDYEQLNNRYAGLNQAYDESLKRSVELNEKYDANASKFSALSDRYQTIAEDFDELAGKYRNAAINSTSVFTIDAGIGMTSDVKPMVLLGVGREWWKIWGVMHEEDHGLALGTSFRF